MKKIFPILCLFILVGWNVAAQNPFLKDGSNIFLKTSTDKVGIGTASTSDKVTIASVAGETILGLKGYPGQYSPYLSCYNSNSVAVFKLFANADWWTFGTTSDTTLALVVGRSARSWFRINGTLKATNVVTTNETVTTSSINHLTITDTTGFVITNGRVIYRIHVTAGGVLTATGMPQ